MSEPWDLKLPWFSPYILGAAMTGEGFEELLEKLDQKLQEGLQQG
jgi:hypothetical protein